MPFLSRRFIIASWVYSVAYKQFLDAYRFPLSIFPQDSYSKNVSTAYCLKKGPPGRQGAGSLRGFLCFPFHIYTEGPQGK